MSEYHEPEPQNSPVREPPPTPGRAPRRSSRLFWGFMGGCFLLFVVTSAGLLIAVSLMEADNDLWIPSGSVAVVYVEGEILEARSAVDDIRRHAENDAIEAVVIRIDSPGGAIVPSQEIYREIIKARERSGKPFVASLQGLAASGGYYVASACDLIVSNPGTITGSIGVIFQWMNVEGLLDWARIKTETITSGSMKDAGSPYRELTDEERVYFEGLLEQFHEQFIRAVLDGRAGRMTEDEVRSVADGRVFTGEEALALKLVDRIGTLHDSIDVAAELAGIDGPPNVVYPQPEEFTLFDYLFGVKNPEKLLRRMVGVDRPHPFAYRWY